MGRSARRGGGEGWNGWGVVTCTADAWDITTGPEAGRIGAGPVSRGVIRTPGLGPRGRDTLGREDIPGLISLGRPRVV